MNTYEINTIADILDKIPDDCFEVFLAELPEGLRQLKTANKSAIAICRMYQIDPNSVSVGKFVWNDDDVEGISKLTLSVKNGDEVLASETIKL